MRPTGISVADLFWGEARRQAFEVAQTALQPTDERVERLGQQVQNLSRLGGQEFAQIAREIRELQGMDSRVQQYLGQLCEHTNGRFGHLEERLAQAFTMVDNGLKENGAEQARGLGRVWERMQAVEGELKGILESEYRSPAAPSHGTPSLSPPLSGDPLACRTGRQVP